MTTRKNADVPIQNPKTPPGVSLDLMPAFYHKHLGLRFGEAYYFDLDHRARVEREKGRFLHDVLGRYGVGHPAGFAANSLFVQPVDLVMHTQGAPWHFPEDATLESGGAPWASLKIEEIARIDPRAAASHPVVDRVLAHYAELTRRYGETADILCVKSGLLNVHTPYTTAHQLYGQELFTLLLESPNDARTIFAKVWEIYEAIFARLSGALGTRFKKVQLGDCAASLLSPATYRDVVLPINLEIARRYPAMGYHSCGVSTHLLGEFARLGPIENIQLGPGTDMAEAAQRLPGVCLEPLFDPILMRNGTTAGIAQAVEKTLRDCRGVPAVTLCVWSCDRDTPVDNLVALYETVRSYA